MSSGRCLSTARCSSYANAVRLKSAYSDKIIANRTTGITASFRFAFFLPSPMVTTQSRHAMAAQGVGSPWRSMTIGDLWIFSRAPARAAASVRKFRMQVRNHRMAVHKLGIYIPCLRIKLAGDWRSGLTTNGWGMVAGGGREASAERKEAAPDRKKAASDR